MKKKFTFSKKNANIIHYVSTYIGTTNNLLVYGLWPSFGSPGSAFFDQQLTNQPLEYTYFLFDNLAYRCSPRSTAINCNYCFDYLAFGFLWHNCCSHAVQFDNHCRNCRPRPLPDYQEIIQETLLLDKVKIGKKSYNRFTHGQHY